MLNYPYLWDFALGQRERFLARKPFPFIVMDNFLSPDLLEAACEAFPPPDTDFWHRTDNKQTNNKLTPDGFGGTQMLKEIRFPDAARFVFAELNSGLFLWFLFKLTGIELLMSDPYFIEGGYHCVGNEGRLGIHADFSHHPYYKTERRVNLLLYLNPTWKEEWGGALKLYDERLKPTPPIWPLMNRAVIFLTSATSYHGHPEPMALPEGVWRKSLALYYYTPPRAEREHKVAVFPVAA